MAEAIGLGASVVAFIGLAGQVAQGCEYFLTLVNDLRDASEDLQSLYSEAKLFQLSVESFKDQLATFEDSGFPTNVGGCAQAVQLALEYGEEAVEKLLKFARKISGNKWSAVRFAFGKDKCAKLAGRVHRASGHVATAQASILLSVEHQQALGIRATHQILGSLTSTINGSSKNIDSLATRLDGISLHTAKIQTGIIELEKGISDTSSVIVDSLTTKLDGVSLDTRSTNRVVTELKNDFSQRLHDLSAGVNAILSSKFTAATSIVSQGQTGSYEAHHSIRETNAAVEALHATSEGLKRLPLSMLGVVIETFRGVLLEFYLDRTLEASQISQTHADCLNELHKVFSHPGTWQLKRRVLRQTACTRKYIRHVGIITVQSTTTTFCELAPGNSPKPYPKISTITNTNLDLNPNPDLLRLGIYFSFIQQGFGQFDSAPEPRLRLYNMVDLDSPIVKACISGNIAVVRWLFDSEQASPFDQLWGDRSLLDLILMRVIQVVSCRGGSGQQAKVNGLIAIYAELVRHGLDPGVPRVNRDLYGISPIIALAILNQKSSSFTPEILQLGRIIIRSSICDPFESADIHRLAWQVEIAGLPMLPLYTILRSQDEWPFDWSSPDSLRKVQRSKTIEELGNVSNGSFDRNRPWDVTLSNYPLLAATLYCDADASVVQSLMEDCPILEKKLLVVRAIIVLITCESSICHPSRWIRPLPISRARLERRLQESIEICLMSGLNIDEFSLRGINWKAPTKRLPILESLLIGISQTPTSPEEMPGDFLGEYDGIEIGFANSHEEDIKGEASSGEILPWL